MNTDFSDKYTNMLTDDKLLLQYAIISECKRTFSNDTTLTEKTNAHIKKIEKLCPMSNINQRNISCIEKYQLERIKK